MPQPKTHNLELTGDEAQMLYALADRGIQHGLPGGMNGVPLAYSVLQKMAALGQEQEEPKDG